MEPDDQVKWKLCTSRNAPSFRFTKHNQLAFKAYTSNFEEEEEEEEDDHSTFGHHAGHHGGHRELGKKKKNKKKKKKKCHVKKEDFCLTAVPFDKRSTGYKVKAKLCDPADFMQKWLISPFYGYKEHWRIYLPEKDRWLTMVLTEQSSLFDKVSKQSASSTENESLSRSRFEEDKVWSKDEIESLLGFDSDESIDEQFKEIFPGVTSSDIDEIEEDLVAYFNDGFDKANVKQEYHTKKHHHAHLHDHEWEREWVVGLDKIKTSGSQDIQIFTDLDCQDFSHGKTRHLHYGN